jgi:hypothetical protein
MKSLQSAALINIVSNMTLEEKLVLRKQLDVEIHHGRENSLHIKVNKKLLDLILSTFTAQSFHISAVLFDGHSLSWDVDEDLDFDENPTKKKFDNDPKLADNLVVYEFAKDVDFDEMVDNLDDPEALALFETIKSTLKADGLNTLFYTDKSISLRHDRKPPNYDSRGMVELDFQLQYHNQWYFPPGYYTLYDFVNAIYRMKSHKFENWYEMFEGVKVQQSFNTYNVSVEIGYGS